MAKRESVSTVPVHITGLFLVFAAAFLLLALVSYSPEDPGFTLSRHTETFHNWMGFVGSYIADGLYIVMGIWSFALPVFMIDYAYRYCLKKHPANWLHIAGTIIIMFAVLGMLHIFLGEISLFSKPIKAGGVIGKIIGDSLVGYLNRWGSLVLLLMLLAGGVMMGYDLAAAARSLRDTAERIREKRILPVKKKDTAERVSEPRAGRASSARAKAEKEPTGGKEPRITLMEHDHHEASEIPKQATLDFIDNYQFPPISLLSNPPSKSRTITEKELKANASLILS
ncbi:MAG TPA: DNA translocase FtsK 4TM domain-containing protein, partial [Deltaproteobacteria bacterium]|nr:DNA translocase FtsK 4TM domain-containing protein [Deltaproteobacteria bacterium]